MFQHDTPIGPVRLIVIGRDEECPGLLVCAEIDASGAQSVENYWERDMVKRWS